MSTRTRCLIGCTDTLLEDIQDRQHHQADVAVTYFLALRSDTLQQDEVDWETVDRAIVKRWSISGRESIRNKAHKLYKTAYPRESRHLWTHAQK